MGINDSLGEHDPDFLGATRRLLFVEEQQEEVSQDIPGAGRSAAEMPAQHTRVKVTINLDGNIVAHFKKLAKQQGRAYQSLINQVLREYVLGSEPEQLARKVEEIILSDEVFLERLVARVQDALQEEGA